MTTLREAVANLIKVKGRHNTEIAYQRLIEAYDAALAAKEPEPVAWMDAHDSTNLYYRKPPQGDVIPLYFAPPKEIK